MFSTSQRRASAPDQITPGQADRLLAGLEPSGPAAQARHQLTAEHIADLRHLDTAATGA